jgi:hypothetical protein
MRLAALIDAQLYMRNMQQCDDSLLEKRDAFSVSTTHAIQTRDRGAKKFESLKDFEVCDVLEKELRFNVQG